MNETYLPGNARERILDLMKNRKVTQKELSQRIDITESALSRFLSGATDRLDSEALLRIARCFGVSADFLLGETAVPDRKNYEIVELGLSAQAARNLYTGRVCADVVSRLLESPRFAELTFLLQRYCLQILRFGNLRLRIAVTIQLFKCFYRFLIFPRLLQRYCVPIVVTWLND